MKTDRTAVAILQSTFLVGLLIACTNTQAAEPASIRYAETPKSILTPDEVKTRIGTLRFFDGFPDKGTVRKGYDHLDFLRGTRAFLDTLPIASLHAMREGFRDVGCVDGTVGIFENLMDSRTLFLTANTESVYAVTWLDLKDGPVVVESPPNTLGIMDDFFFNYVTDLGNAGPDRGKGGKFLFLPPGYKGEVPDGYFTFRSATYGNWLIWRGFQVDGDAKPAVASIKENTRIYPLAKRDNPPEQKFVNLSGRAFNTIHANDFTFFEEVNEVIQEEPIESLDPELLGLLASIGIEKGKAFEPDARMKKILTDAAAVGNATARAIVFVTRDPEAFLFENSAWKTGFIGGSHEFERDGVRLLDGRSLFFYYATGITPAMSAKMVGAGSQYAGAMIDADGSYLDGGKTYRLHFPPDVPAKDFWSLVVYDNQTRSMLQTDQQFPSLNSQRGVQQNADGSTDIYFGPKAPVGKESNWIQTVPGKGYTVILRLYGPLEPWFDKKWQPGEIAFMQDVPVVKPTRKRCKMATDIPSSITTPDRVETRIGTLKFVDGFPTKETVKLVYDNLDFLRCVEAFLVGMPAASTLANRTGFREAGLVRNGVVGIYEDLLDARTLVLTPNTESIYIGTWLDLSEGPMVVESPPNTLGMVNDLFMRYVTDMGNAGPDKGKGGKFLILPPDWEGEVPDGYFVARSQTYGNLVFWRGFLVDGDPAPAVASAKKHVRIYPLAWPRDREKTRFKNISGLPLNTIHANDIDFYRELDVVIQEEPAEAFSPELLGLFAAIGIEKGKRFHPDDRMRAILTEGVAVANATARAISFRSRNPNCVIFEGGHWISPFPGGDYQFLTPSGARDLDGRVMFHYPYIAISPAMAMKMVGVGSQYGVVFVDSQGNYLDGKKTYQVTLPKGIPAKDFWSFVLYDPQTRSILQTPRTAFPSLNSERSGVEFNEDGSCTIYFGPKAPQRKEKNWIQTVPGKGWFTILRLYGPLEPWFDKTWKPGEIELSK